MAQVAHVLYCVEIDAATQTCIQQAWLPAPSLLPPLTVEGAAQILAASALLLGVAWCWKKLGQQTNR